MSEDLGHLDYKAFEVLLVGAVEWVEEAHPVLEERLVLMEKQAKLVPKVYKVDPDQ